MEINMMMNHTQGPWTGYDGMGAEYWAEFRLPSHVDLIGAPGTSLLDVGTGTGVRVSELAKTARIAVVTDVDLGALKRCANTHLLRVCCQAEALPFREGSFDCTTCFVALPYMNPAAAIAEMARTLRGTNARLVVTGHGPGYYLRYLLRPPSMALFLYSLFTIINSAVFMILGRRLFRRAGDIWQSRYVLGRCYRQAKLIVLRESESERYHGLTVLLHQTLRRLS